MLTEEMCYYDRIVRIVVSILAIQTVLSANLLLAVIYLLLLIVIIFLEKECERTTDTI